MPRKFKEARQINKLKVIEAAAKLGVSQPALSAWEGERKSPGLDHLENMADLYGVSTDYLLGRSEPGAGDPNGSHFNPSSASFSWEASMAGAVWLATGQCH